ncbi:putative soluble quinoprotein glucose/sorbosone dehydrogenase [Septoria linicola]|nr:putative soluble quinoprotein glucose/sorbosone dehydrogenase [Septoria linicola]
MATSKRLRTFLAASVLCTLATAQSTTTPPSSAAQCSSTLTASYAAPSLAPGYRAQIIANGLTNPRGIKFDNQGALLVVQQGVGISAHTIADAGNDCLSVSGMKMVVENEDLNHGIEISGDGRTLYSSSSESLLAWDYDANDMTTTSDSRELVNGMDGSDHTSRTLLLSRSAPGMILINRGSFSNFDPLALDITTGVSQIKAFNVSNATDTAYNFTTSGLMLGWGLRNNVGIAEDPITGGIYSVENSADQVNRSNTDIHQNNPAEKLNFLGYLNGTQSPNQGRNFGYPQCFAAWQPSSVPDFSGQVGEQFAVDFNGIVGENNGPNDTLCTDRQSPRLSFNAHMAPLDMLFTEDGSTAWISFHGSWNRDSPIGYKLAYVDFANGEPTEASDSTTALKDVMTNMDTSACPGGCFRPVGLAWDSQGRLFMSSDSTGEIYVITRTDGKKVNETATGTAVSGGANGTESGAAMESSSAAAVANVVGKGVLTGLLGFAGFFL